LSVINTKEPGKAAGFAAFSGFAAETRKKQDIVIYKNFITL
jgi:hypothetical protein